MSHFAIMGVVSESRRYIIFFFFNQLYTNIKSGAVFTQCFHALFTLKYLVFTFIWENMFA